MKISWILASTLLFSCSGGGGNDNKGGTPSAPTASSLSLGVIKLDMKATNLQDPTASANPQQGNSSVTVQPGSLSIGASLNSSTNLSAFQLQTTQFSVALISELPP